MSEFLLLGCDLALRNTGVVLVDSSLRVVDLAVITTAAPAPKKMRATGELGVADRLASVELYRELRSWMSRADAVVYECAFSHYGRAATTGALARAAFAIAAEEEKIEVEGYSETDVKVAAWGSGATKSQVAAGATACFGTDLQAVANALGSPGEAILEETCGHVFDALGVVMAAARGNLLRRSLEPTFIEKLQDGPRVARAAAQRQRALPLEART
jgi:Holliday junction resolvasome RuvABC endonuclease subunit